MAGKIYFFTLYSAQYDGHYGLPIEMDGVIPTEPVQIGTDSDWADVATIYALDGFVGLKTSGALWGAGDDTTMLGPTPITYAPAALPFPEIFTNLYGAPDVDSLNSLALWLRDTDGNFYTQGEPYGSPFLGLAAPTFDPFIEPTPLTLPAGSSALFSPSAFEQLTRVRVDGVDYTAYGEYSHWHNLPLGEVPTYDSGTDTPLIPEQLEFAVETYPDTYVQFTNCGMVDGSVALDSTGNVYIHVSTYAGMPGGIETYKTYRFLVLSNVAMVRGQVYDNGMFYITTDGELRYYSLTDLDIVFDGIGDLVSSDIPTATFAVNPGTSYSYVAYSMDTNVTIAIEAGTGALHLWAMNTFTSGSDFSLYTPFPTPETLLPGQAVAKVAFAGYGETMIILTGAPSGPTPPTQFWEGLVNATQF